MPEEENHIAVFILTAGLGTRLRPLTDTLPKVMLPIAPGKPLLEHTVTLLRDQGFRNFIFNLHYLPEKITKYFGDGFRFKISIQYSDESERALETAGAIKKAAPFLTDPFIFLYGDELHFFDFVRLLAFHENQHAFGTVVLKRSDLPQNGDLARIDPHTKKIVEWIHRPHNIREFGDNLFLNAGLYVFSKKILDHIDSDQPKKLDAEVLPSLIKNGKEIFGYVAEEEILDIGTPEKYEFAKRWYAAHRDSLTEK